MVNILFLSFAEGQRAQTEDENLGSTKVKRKKRQPFTLDFENPSEIDTSLFMPAEDLRSTLLLQRGAAFNGLLPEDVHYEALNLVHLFLRPSVLVSNILSHVFLNDQDDWVLGLRFAT